ncbi:MAG: peptidase S8 [Leptolyngbya foveolarum]|uniref:Peptidase S8 n=1 Tax=Leptolyngbya foveolarum TaxID=47253 RepID=A0A2W4U710_9CYAN|nr:MAG: peptidase S8 [Leptolyngbya foveolarum]
MALAESEGAKGVLPSKEGEILQRGGEELQLYKIRDRLSFCLQSVDSASDAISRLTARWQPRQTKDITPQAIGQNSALFEWQLPAQQVDAALESLRDSPEVLYASHVYEMALSPGTYLYLANQLTVQFTEGLSVMQVEALAQPLGLVRSHSLSGDRNTHCFFVGPNARKNPLKIANELTRYPDVLLAEPNIIIETASLYRPSDPRYPEQWHLYHRGGSSLAPNSHVSAEKAWDITRGSRAITVAVTDDGFDLNHPDFQGAGKIVAPRDLKHRDGLPVPEEAENHGTAVAGVAIAEENGEGIVGIAPGCSFMPIQTTGFLDDASVEQLFDWAIEQGADVISCSWSPASVYFPLSRRISRAINRAATQGRGGKGCVVVFSAGNANRPLAGKVEESGWPQNLIRGLTDWLSGFAVHPDVITVSASTSLNQKAAYSNWGRNISVAAPSNNAPPNMALSAGVFDTGPPIRQALAGRAVLTSDRTGPQGYTLDDYTGFGGTSSACPLVAGIVGLMLSVNPDLSAREVKQILQVTTDKIIDKDPDPQLGQKYGTYDKDGHSLWFGYGKVNAYQAVKVSQARALSDRALHQTITATNSASTPIPDNDPRGLLSAVEVSDRGLLQDLKVFIQAEHEFLGDVSFTLLSPSDESILIQSRTLGRQTRLQRTYSLVSTPAIRRLLNTEIRGRWQLQVVDHVAGHTGRLKKWELVFGI